MSVALRSYQLEAIARLRAEAMLGRRALLLVACVGSGKTTMFAEIARRHVELGGHVLVLAHRRELVSQAADRLETFGLRVGVIGGDRPNPFARVQIATIQTLLAREHRPLASLVLIDEAHHFQPDATEWGAFLAQYATALRIGFTATPERSDGAGLGALFDSLTVAASIKELTEQGHLVPCSVIAPSSSLKSGEIAQRPVDAYLQHARGRRAIVFSPHVKAAVQHAMEFREAGVKCAVVTGDMTIAARNQALRDYAAGYVPVLCNVQVLTEGIDIPATEAVIIARGIGTVGLYVQIVGRALRPSPGKRDALVLDLRGVVHVHGRPDEERMYSLEGKAIRRDPDDIEARFCVTCGAPLGIAVVCPECGRAPSELAAPTVTGAPLVKFEAKRRESEEERVATLAKWLLIARGRGFKEGWAHNKYRVVYGDWPPFAVRRAAVERTRGAA